MSRIAGALIEKEGEIKTPSKSRFGGRKPGVPNKSTQFLKDAILLAAERSGEDTQGKGGLVGYLYRVANEDVKAFSSLLGRVLPLQLTGAGGGPIELTIEALLQRVAENHQAIHAKVIEHDDEPGE